MTRLFKKLTLAVMIGALSLTVTPVFAANSGQERELVKSERVMSDGISLVVNTYNDNGYMVETVNTENEYLKQDSSRVRNAIKNYAEQSQKEDMQNNSMKENLSEKAYSEDKDFNKSAQAPSNRDAYVGHWGTFTDNEGGRWDSPQIELTNGAVRGLYDGTGSFKQIQLSETYTWSGSDLSISWPAGVSIGSSEKVGTWSSLSYDDTLATAYRPDLSAYTEVYIYGQFKLNVTSRSDIYVGSNSYAASVSTTNTWQGKIS